MPRPLTATSSPTVSAATIAAITASKPFQRLLGIAEAVIENDLIWLAAHRPKAVERSVSAVTTAILEGACWDFLNEAQDYLETEISDRDNNGLLLEYLDKHPGLTVLKADMFAAGSAEALFLYEESNAGEVSRDAIVERYAESAGIVPQVEQFLETAD